MRNKLMPLIVILLFAVLASACGPALVAQAQATQPPTGETVSPRTISVTGSGRAYLNPDIAHIYIGVHTEAADAADAVADNNTQSQEVVDALRAVGVAANDIQTTNFSIYPQQQYDSTGKLTETRYAVDNTVFVTLRDLDDLGNVLDRVIAAGANSINGIQFDVADRTAALSEAREAAVADARTQAEELADAAGLELGDIQAINSYSGQNPVPLFEGRGGGMDMAQAASVPVSPGQLVVSLDVNVVFQIQ